MEDDEGRSQTTIDVESTVDNEETGMSYQGYPMYLFVLNGFFNLKKKKSSPKESKMTRSLITEAARADEKKFLGQTKAQLKSLMFLG